MLRHTGERRSFRHDLRLAILLCLNAGFINAAGFIAFAVLTTNVTGHAALLAVDVSSGDWRAARMVALWLVLFLGGAFTSSLYIARVGRSRSYAYTVPILFIIGILCFVAIFGPGYRHTLPETEYFAGSLLFAMGMQNALVSVISGSVVRTTHLTGMFTDLGIDLAEAISIKQQDRATWSRLTLRASIITSFLLGGVAGGIVFQRVSFAAFYIPVCLLVFALLYDYFRISVRRVVQRHTK